MRRLLALFLSSFLALSPMRAGAQALRAVPKKTAGTPASPARIGGPFGSAGQWAPFSQSVSPNIRPALSGLPGTSPSPSVEKTPAASMPTRIIVGPGTFSVGEMDALLEPKFRKRVRSIEDPKKRQEYISAHTPNNPFDIRWVLERELGAFGKDWFLKTTADRRKAYAKFQRKLKHYEKILPEIMEGHFFDTLSRYEHTVSRGRTHQVYEIPRGLEFWQELLEAQDLRRTVAGHVLLRSSAHRIEEDRPVRVLSGIKSTLDSKTQLLDSSRLSKPELGIIKALAKKQKRRTKTFGDLLLVGGGISFHVAARIMKSAARLEDPGLVRAFDRVVRYFVARGIQIVYDEHQGAAAYYNPSEDEMAYVMPSRGDINSTAHEGNHARFQKFQKTLKTWAEKNNLAIPYEIDGPQYALFGAPFGGFMNLLNELNSWRIGEAFDGGKTDAKILKLLRRAYGRQTGWDNVRLFSKIWTPSRVKGRSVPRIILDSVRALNALDEDQFTALGQEAVAEKDRIKAFNFMRLVRARYPDLKKLPAARRNHLGVLLDHPDEGVRWMAENLLDKPHPKQKKEADDEDAEAKYLTDEKNPRDERLERLLDLMREAAEEGKKSSNRQERAVRVLTEAMDRWKIEMLYPPSSLKSMNDIDKAWGTESEHKNRPVDADHILFDPKVDGFLAAAMFDGERSVHRLDLANLIRTRTYPAELPMLHQRLLDVITDDDALYNDLWLARLFLIPDKEFFAAHLAWGESVVDAIRSDKSPSVEALEFAGEYYRLALASALPGDKWGKWTNNLDAGMRRDALKKMRGFNAAERRYYDKAVAHLWKLLAHENARVRASARFAVAGYPGFIIGMENNILRTLAAKQSKYLPEVLELVEMLEPGFLPSIDRALKARLAQKRVH